MNKCKCGCGSETNKIYCRGHNLRVNPLTGSKNYFYGKNEYGEKAHHWKGGRRKLYGYWYITVPPTHPNRNKMGVIPEHHFVMEKILGRYIDKKKEVVHHIDENKLNNDLLNLSLLEKRRHFQLHIRMNCINEKGQFTSKNSHEVNA